MTTNQIVDLPNEAASALKRLRPQWQLDAVTDVELLPGGYANDNYQLTYRDADYVLRIARPSPVAVDRAFEKRLLGGPVALLTAPLVAYLLPEGHMLTRKVAGPLLVRLRQRRVSRCADRCRTAARAAWWPGSTTARPTGAARRRHW